MRLPFATLKFDGEMSALCERARALAVLFGHDYVGVEHFFLCLRDLPDDHPVLGILTATKIDLSSFWQVLETKARIETGRPSSADPPLTPRARSVLKLARSFATKDKARSAGLLHFLFAVSHERGSLPAVLLAQHYLQQFPQYDGNDFLAQQLIGFACFEDRRFLSFRHAPRDPKGQKN
jgi:ATP-dependent Clp protease ATP-binding subunit ClpA